MSSGMGTTWVALVSGACLLLEAPAPRNQSKALSACQALGVRAQHAVRLEPDLGVLARTRGLDLWVVIDDHDPVRRAEEIRGAGFTGMLCVISADEHARAETAALDAGADGYCTTTVACELLAARFRSLIRRNAPDPRSSLPVDKLSRRERDVVQYLRVRAGTWVKRDQLMRELFGSNKGYDSSLVRTHVLNIKRKLGPAGSQLRSDRIEGVMWIEAGGRAHETVGSLTSVVPNRRL